MEVRTRSRLILQALAIAATLQGIAPAAYAEVKPGDPWARLPEILSRIQPPTFPARDFVITKFGAKPDGKTDATAAFRKAIAACHEAGGGRVVVPAGKFLTGPIVLKSNVNLHVSAGATVLFSRNPKDYLPVVKTRWEGVELMNYSPLIYAYEQQNIAITGEGTLDGQADAQHWWPWKATTGPVSQKPARDRLFKQAEDGVPVEQRVYGEGGFLRPQFIQPYLCKNILIEGVTIRSSPMWLIHPVLSQNITIRKVKAVSDGPNSDGCDPESCSDVLIEDTLFDTGDDCIALKSGRNADGRRINVPVERVVIRNCEMRAGHGGVTIGSEISGGARDVYAEKCVMSSPDLDRGLRFKTNAVRGGVIENVFMRDVRIGEVGSAIDMNMYYEEGPNGAFPPVLRNVLVERLTVDKARHALFIRTLDKSPVEGLVVRDSVFNGLASGNRIEGIVNMILENVTLVPAPTPAPAATGAGSR